jgi:hypothetical protein
VPTGGQRSTPFRRTPPSHDFAPCEVNDRIDDGPWVPCPRLGRLCLRWNAEIGAVEEAYLCAEHEQMMYSCQECGEPKGTWRGQYCDDCRNLDAQGIAED